MCGTRRARGTNAGAACPLPRAISQAINPERLAASPVYPRLRQRRGQRRGEAVTIIITITVITTITTVTDSPSVTITCVCDVASPGVTTCVIDQSVPFVVAFGSASSSSKAARYRPRTHTRSRTGKRWGRGLHPCPHTSPPTHRPAASAEEEGQGWQSEGARISRDPSPRARVAQL